MALIRLTLKSTDTGSEKSKNNADVICGWSLTTVKEFLQMATGNRQMVNNGPNLVKVVKKRPLADAKSKYERFTYCFVLNLGSKSIHK